MINNAYLCSMNNGKSADGPAVRPHDEGENSTRQDPNFLKHKDKRNTRCTLS